MTAEEIRAEFVRLLTEDSETKDARRRDFNQAIFFPGDDPIFPGHAVFTGTDLGMVMAAFDKAVKRLKVQDAKAGLRGGR